MAVNYARRKVGAVEQNLSAQGSRAPTAGTDGVAQVELLTTIGSNVTGIREEVLLAGRRSLHKPGTRLMMFRNHLYSCRRKA